MLTQNASRLSTDQFDDTTIRQNNKLKNTYLSQLSSNNNANPNANPKNSSTIRMGSSNGYDFSAISNNLHSSLTSDEYGILTKEYNRRKFIEGQARMSAWSKGS